MPERPNRRKGATPSTRSRARAPRGAGRRSLYAGSQTSRLTADWVFAACSSDQEVRSNLRRLRLRARDLQRNSPLIRWYLTLLKSNVVGKAAPRLTPKVRVGLTPTGQLDKQVNAYLIEQFAAWGREVTTDGRLNLVRFLWHAVQSLATDGEVFVRRVVGYPHNRWGFALDVIEPDLIDEDLNTEPRGGRGADIRMGVEVDEWRRPAAYWVWTGYPDEGFNRERVRVPASEVCHLYDHDRVMQTRGVTWMKAILLQLRMLDGFFEAELVASRASAQKIAGLKYKDADSFSAPDPDEGPVQIETSPGELFQIPPGMELETWDPQHPNAAFAEFVKGAQRMLSGGLGAFYNTLANDGEGISWSSMRSFLLVERDVWQMVQTLICETLLPWIYEGWLQTATLTGAVRLPRADWRLYADHEFRPRGWAWVDPNNEAKAANTQLAGGITSPQRVVAQRGEDIEDILEERQTFRRLCEEYGEDADALAAAWAGGAAPADPAASDSTLTETDPQNGDDPAHDEPDQDDEDA